MWTAEVAVVLLHERIVAALDAERVWGWAPYPAHVEGASTATFSGLRVTGRCGPLDRTRGEWVQKDDNVRLERLCDSLTSETVLRNTISTKQ